MIRILCAYSLAAAAIACMPFSGVDVGVQPTAPPAAIASDSIDLAEKIGRDVAVLYDSASTLLLRFDAPPAFDQWRAQVERCSGRARSGSPTYWIAQTTRLPRDWLAMYHVPSRCVVFGLGNEVVGWIVMHELLHDALGTHEHDPEYFEQRCRALVNPPERSR